MNESRNADRLPRGARWVAAGVLFLFGVLLIPAALGVLSSDDPRKLPMWLLLLLGAAILLMGVATLRPKRQATVMFSVALTMLLALSLWIPFSPWPLESTLELITPFGFYGWRLGNWQTRVMAAVIAVITIGLVAVVLTASLQEQFGQRRWLLALQGVGLLIVLPVVAVMIAVMLIMMAPIALWRGITGRSGDQGR